MPASVDSIPSSNGQEDHVSMGANAALKGYKILKNLETILAIELLTAAQALDLRLRNGIQTSNKLKAFHASFRKSVPFMESDRLLREDIEKSARFLREYDSE